jgi:PAS domain S-box-containing protein
VRDLLNADQISWFQKSADGKDFVPMRSANAAHDPWTEACATNRLAWLTQTISSGQPVRISSLKELPKDATKERMAMEKSGITSFAVIPSSSGADARGALLISSYWNKIEWDEQVIAQLAMLSSMFASAQTRKVAQDAMRASELRFRQLFDDSPMGIALLNARGQILVANCALAKLLGRTSEELSLKTLLDVTLPDDMPKTWLHFQELLEGSRDICHIEERFRRKNGSALHARITMSFVGARNTDERLVLAMIEDHTEANRVKEQLEHSRRMLTLALEASRTTAWEYDPPADEIMWLDRKKLREPEGQMPASDSFSNVLSHVVPEDWERLRSVTERIVRDGGVFSTEFRMIGKDGSVRWMLGKGELSNRAADSSPKIVGVTVDVSGIKRAQLELQELAKRLMEAQEAERKKISRDLHDDIGQRVALLAMELDIIGQQLPDEHELKSRMQKVQHSAEELGSDLHQISHSLHSSKLQYLGLQAALRDLCNRIADKHALIVELDATDEKPYLREEEALALFRVAQEALNNVVRHSNATVARIVLSISETHANLAVIDDGKGFNPQAPSSGIGLVGMRERIRAIGGEFRIVSTRQGGTEIHASVELPKRASHPAKTMAAGS